LKKLKKPPNNFHFSLAMALALRWLHYSSRAPVFSSKYKGFGTPKRRFIKSSDGGQVQKCLLGVCPVAL
jgi:hypothetical protein